MARTRRRHPGQHGVNLAWPGGTGTTIWPLLSRNLILITLPHGHSITVHGGWVGSPFTRTRKVHEWINEGC